MRATIADPVIADAKRRMLASARHYQRAIDELLPGYARP
jgi:hypothetical protein